MPSRKPVPCSRPGCSKRARVRGLCRPHATAHGLADDYHDAAEARRIIHRILDGGASISDIERTGIISKGAICNILSGVYEHCQLATLKKLRRVEHTLRPRFVPAWRAQRRIRSLVVAGTPQYELARTLGLSRSYLSSICRLHTDAVRFEKFDRIDTYYRAHELDPIGEMPSLQKGLTPLWKKPLEWDDIDNPEELPFSDSAPGYIPVEGQLMGYVKTLNQHVASGGAVSITEDTLDQLLRRRRIRITRRIALELEAEAGRIHRIRNAEYLTQYRTAKERTLNDQLRVADAA